MHHKILTYKECQIFKTVKKIRKKAYKYWEKIICKERKNGQDFPMKKRSENESILFI